MHSMLSLGASCKTVLAGSTHCLADNILCAKLGVAHLGAVDVQQGEAGLSGEGGPGGQGGPGGMHFQYNVRMATSKHPKPVMLVHFTRVLLPLEILPLVPT